MGNSNRRSRPGLPTAFSCSLLDRREHFQNQVLLKILGKLRAVAEADEDQVEAGNYPSVVVIFAAGDDEVGRAAGQIGEGPPLTAIVVFDRRRRPGEIV